MTKIECEQCHQVGSLQILGNYARVRHQVIDTETKTSKYVWHQNSKAYVDQKLRIVQEIVQTTITIDQDQNNKGLDQLKEPRAGIEPATYSLQGCCSTD
jgi:hypothetical protein